MNHRTQSTFDRELYARQKMQFYPTDEGESRKMSKLFDFGEGDITVLEPCIGNSNGVKAFLEKDGRVLENAHIFGVELDTKRYQDHIKDDEEIAYAINADFLHIKCSRRSFSLCYSNPPYDNDIIDKGRVENEFLKKITQYIAYGGYLIWIVPIHLLRFAESRRAIAKRYEVVDIYRFSDPVYQQFKQVALIGRLRSERDSKDEEKDEDFIQRAAINPEGLKTLNDIEEKAYKVRTMSPDKVQIFQGSHLDEDVALERLSSSTLYKAMNNEVRVNPYGIATGRPPLMPNADQLFNMIAVGRAPIKKVSGGILQRGVIKEYKTTVEEPAGRGKTKVTEITFTKSSITLIERNGNIIRLEK